MSPRFLCREKPKIRARRFGTWDIETYGLGGKFAQAWTWQGPDSDPLRHDTLTSLFDTLMYPDRGTTPTGKPCRAAFNWLAHNGAKYDFTYLALMLREHAVTNHVTISTVPQGRKLVQLTIPTTGGTVNLRDTYPLLTMSLDTAARTFAPSQPKSGHCPSHDFTANPDTTFDPSCETCCAYARQDVITLWHTYNTCRSLIINRFDVEPGITIGSTGVRAWQSTIPKGHVYYRQAPAKEMFLRQFTTGAYITPGHTSELLTPPSGWKYAAITADRCAAFAACMLEGGYPTSAGIWTHNYEPSVLGYYEVTATCPTDYPDQHPIVPLTDQNGRRAWATGTGTAYITSEQYEACLAHGYQLKVIQGLVFERTEDIFGAFLRKCEDLEFPPDGSAVDPGIKAIVKGMRNALNGKFNMRPVQERLYIGEPPDGAIPIIDQDTGDSLPLYALEEKVDSPVTHPEFYVLTVSRQQLEEVRLVDLMEPEERLKCDTDSITTCEERMLWLEDHGHIKIAPGYGNYKYEHRWLEHQSLGPKNYHGVDDDGSYVANCKGIPQSLIRDLRQDHLRAGDGETVQVKFRSLRSMREMLEGNDPVPGVRRVRTIGRPDSVIGWQHDKRTKQFKPIHFIGGENGTSGEV